MAELAVHKGEIKSDRKFELGSDGSLRVRSVEPADAGTYVCEAVNGVGSSLSKSIRLDVNGKPIMMMTMMLVYFGRLMWRI